MVNVLIIGATGYVGHALSQSLIRSGNHRVFGLARTPEKSNALAASEVIPILGTISPSLLEAIATHRIDTVVDVSGANQESHSLLSLVREAGGERLAAAKKEGSPAVPKLGFIYCSGTWVHGSSNEPVNDLMQVGTPSAPVPATELTSWRPELEKAVLASSDMLDVMVVRPALVYGRSCAIWTSFFEPIYAAGQEGATLVSVPADPDSRPGLVHVDDVATGFHAAIEKLPLIAGTGVYPVFDLQTSQEGMRDILEAAARELGVKGGVQLAGAGKDLFMKAMSVSGNGSSGRARSILGWEPKRYGFVQGMDVFVKSWVASRG